MFYLRIDENAAIIFFFFKTSLDFAKSSNPYLCNNSLDLTKSILFICPKSVICEPRSHHFLSERPDSNRQPQHWQCCYLAIDILSHFVPRDGFDPSSPD